MTIRPYRESDRPALLAMHQRQSVHDGLPYLLADPRDPQQFATVVAVEGGRVVASASGRKIAEGSTVLDPNYGGRGSEGPLRRWMLLSGLIRHSARVCFDAGYTELMAATSPEWRGYGNRLVNDLGFTRDLRARFYLDLARVFRKGN
jgi:hypothetical protein